MSEKIECKECGKMMHMITVQHLRLHNIQTTNEYKIRWPGEPIKSEKTITKELNTKKYPDMFQQISPIVQQISPIVQEDIITDEPQIPQKINLIELGNEIVNESENSILKQIERSPIINKSSMPKIEELDLSFITKLDEFKKIEILEYPNPIGLITKDKMILLNFLLSKFTDVQNNYFIEGFSINNIMIYKYVTDISIPDRMIDIEFPNSFWHNYDVAKASRDMHLKRDGWKIIDVNSRMPKLDDLKFELKKWKLI
jgi:hypothetical protein